MTGGLLDTIVLLRLLTSAAHSYFMIPFLFCSFGTEGRIMHKYMYKYTQNFPVTKYLVIL